MTLPSTIVYLEFRADYSRRVALSRMGRTKDHPLPAAADLASCRPDFFPLTCRTCVDYTNVLADITVGYMGR